MASGNPDDLTDVDDLDFDVRGMIAEGGAESVAAVQAPTLGKLGHVITRCQGTHALCMGCRWFRCDNACGLILMRCVSEDWLVV